MNLSLHYKLTQTWANLQKYFLLKPPYTGTYGYAKKRSAKGSNFKEDDSALAL